MRLLIYLIPLLAASSAIAQSNNRFPTHVLEIYRGATEQLEMKLEIEKMMGTYLTHPPRRHQSERVSIKKSSVFVDVWQSVYGLTDEELKCRAIQWLVFGRTQYSKGGRAVLSVLPQFKTIWLRMHEVEHKANSRRVKKGREKIVRYASLKLKRQHLQTLNLATLKKRIDKGSCSKAFKGIFGGKFVSRYTRKRRKLR